jgi:type IV secretory pathway protease TraF
MRLAAIGLMAALACGGIAAGLRYNGTSSYPVGFYLSSGKRAQRGDLVFVSLPSSLVLDMARERGYLNVAYCSVNHLPLSRGDPESPRGGTRNWRTEDFHFVIGKAGEGGS